MKSTEALLVPVLLAAGALALAQGRYGAANPNTPGSAARLNMTQTQTISGVITAVDIGYAAQYPSITVNDTVIKVAPVWYLAEQDFELDVNDSVSVLAAPRNLAGDSYSYAIAITKLETSATLALRDSSGVPLWSGRGGGSTPSLRHSSGRCLCLDPPSVRTITGTVERASFGPGIRMPLLVLKTAEGTLIPVKIGPERVLLAADFELIPGQAVTATVATCQRETVVLQLTNSAGLTVVLRSPDGAGIWN